MEKGWDAGSPGMTATGDAIHSDFCGQISLRLCNDAL